LPRSSDQLEPRRIDILLSGKAKAAAGRWRFQHVPALLPGLGPVVPACGDHKIFLRGRAFDSPFSGKPWSHHRQRTPPTLGSPVHVPTPPAAPFQVGSDRPILFSDDPWRGAHASEPPQICDQAIVSQLALEALFGKASGPFHDGPDASWRTPLYVYEPVDFSRRAYAARPADAAPAWRCFCC